MGGDGGVIASNRRYMRGAGTADCTADYNNPKSKESANGNPREVMTTCALTRAKFQPDSVIVACRYGKLYLREAAIVELLENKQKRKQKDFSSLSNSPLAHVRKLSELYPVRFHNPEGPGAKTLAPACPVTGKALNGAIPATVLAPGNPGQPNVCAESSWKQLDEKQWQEEYGPIDRRIRLAPPASVLEELKASYEQEVLAASNKKGKSKNKDKDKKKRRQDGGNPTASTVEGGERLAAEDRRVSKKARGSSDGGAGAPATMASAMQSNKVLSSLFTSSSQGSKRQLSEKEHKDNLFARC